MAASTSTRTRKPRRRAMPKAAPVQPPQPVQHRRPQSASQVLDLEQESAAAQWLKVAPTDNLVCRKYGHAWTIGLDRVYAINGSFLGQKICCSRCNTERLDLIPRSEYGVVKRRYKYQPGYQRTIEAGEVSTRVPRYLVEETLLERSDILEPPEDVINLFNSYRP